MQYLVGNDSARGLYLDQDGVFQNICNVNGTSDCSPYYSSPLIPSPSAYVLVNNDVIKQTIFGHEAIFRNQVIELHRLYGKQRELMNELRNDFSRKNMQVRLGLSEYGFEEEKPCNVSGLSPFYVPQSDTHTNHVHLEVWENVHSEGAMCQVECTTRHCELLDVSRCKKYNNKVLDLQLLATEYMDNEDTTSSIMAEATYSFNYTSPFSTPNDEHVDQQPLPLGIHGGGTLAESASPSAHPFLFDLNEPFNFEEAIPTTSHEDKPFKDISKNTTQLVSCSSGGTDKNVQRSIAIYNDISNNDSAVQLNCDHDSGQKTTGSDMLNQDSNPSSSVISAISPSSKPIPCIEHLGFDYRLNRSSKKRTLKSRKTEGCLPSSANKTQDTLIRVPKSLQLNAIFKKTENQANHILQPMPSISDFRRNPIVILALPCTNAPVSMQKKKSKSFLTATGPDRKKSHLSEVQHHKRVTKNSTLSDLVKASRKSKKRRSNLRASSLIRDSYRMEPPSPENEECAPPRGESVENSSEKLCQFYTGDDWYAETDVARIAAKAIVYLSAADTCINSHSVCVPSILSPENPLHWFAEVVSNVEFPTEGLPSSIRSQKDLVFQNLNDFEKMIEDTNKEENYCRSILASQDEKLTLLTTVSGRATRARGKRSKKLKDFQGVIIPGISSISKHEVNEDIHLIEGLMEATGTPKMSSSKKRKGCSRGSRQPSNIASIATENSPCSLLDPQNERSNEYRYHHTNERKRTMIDWGNITRRRRGQRHPSRKLTFIQVAHTLKAH